MKDSCCVGQHSVGDDLTFVDPGIRAQGRATASPDFSEEGSFAVDSGTRRFVLDGPQLLQSCHVFGPAFEAQRALRGLRDEGSDGENFGGPVGQAETLERGGGHDDGGEVLSDLGYSGLDVSPQKAELEIRAQVSHLDSPARGTGPDAAALRDCGKRRADQCVARIASLGDRGQTQALDIQRGEIFGRMNRHVGPAIQHGIAHLGDERPGSAKCLHRHVAPAIPKGLHQDEFGVAAHEPSDMFSLPERERTAPGGQPQRSYRRRTASAIRAPSADAADDRISTEGR